MDHPCYLPLFVADWIADTHHLTRAERGLYHDLLVLCWQSPKCRVPNDTEWIKRKLRVAEDEMPWLRQCIAEFMTSDGNWLWQKRLLKEFDFVQKTRQRQSDRAKSGWNKRKIECPGNAERHRSGNAPTLTPTPILKKEDKGYSQPDIYPQNSLEKPEIDREVQALDEKAAFDQFNEMASKTGLPKAQRMTPSRQSALRQRLKECGGLPGWGIALEKVSASNFLTGKNGQGWRADLDFMLQQSSFTKLMEGSYDNRQANGHQQFTPLRQAADRLTDELRSKANGRGSGGIGADIDGLLSRWETP